MVSPKYGSGFEHMDYIVREWRYWDIYLHWYASPYVKLLSVFTVRLSLGTSVEVWGYQWTGQKGPSGSSTFDLDGNTTPDSQVSSSPNPNSPVRLFSQSSLPNGEHKLVITNDGVDLAIDFFKVGIPPALPSPPPVNNPSHPSSLTPSPTSSPTTSAATQPQTATASTENSVTPPATQSSASSGDASTRKPSLPYASGCTHDLSYVAAATSVNDSSLQTTVLSSTTGADPLSPGAPASAPTSAASAATTSSAGSGGAKYDLSSTAHDSQTHPSGASAAMQTDSPSDDSTPSSSSTDGASAGSGSGSTPHSPDTVNHRSSAGAIAGGVIGAILFLLLLATAFVLFRRRQRRRRTRARFRFGASVPLSSAPSLLFSRAPTSPSHARTSRIAHPRRALCTQSRARLGPSRRPHCRPRPWGRARRRRTAGRPGRRARSRRFRSTDIHPRTLLRRSHLRSAPTRRGAANGTRRRCARPRRRRSAHGRSRRSGAILGTDTDMRCDCTIECSKPRLAFLVFRLEVFLYT